MTTLIQSEVPLEVRETCQRLRRGSNPIAWGKRWPHDETVIRAQQVLARETIASCAPSPDTFWGRGIVICAGGSKYFTPAWVCASMLRHLGCALPIQFWHLGERELDQRMRELAADLDVTCVDAEELRYTRPARRLGGWELKAYAILHSRFREVILLDADNVPLIDPATLFATPEYREHGALFWPDRRPLNRNDKIWSICEVEYRAEPSFESGQIVVNKERCWEALNLAMHYSEYSDFYYAHIWGDKDTFHLAFRRVQKSYAMPSTPVYMLGGTMCQHDFQGNRIFQHRNSDKWRFDGSNRRIAGFVHDDLCRTFIKQLRERCGTTREATADRTEKHFSEAGRDGHYDDRFYRGELDDDARTKALIVMLAAFMKAAEPMGIAPVLMHGALLGWHWNKQLLPWDPDIDMCVTLEELARSRTSLGAFRYGEGDYIWEVNPNSASRATLNISPLDAREPNKIDARFIDIANGLYIDVTALAELTPGVLSTKCPHFYRKEHIFPTRRDALNGVPVAVPREVEAVLTQEYGPESIVRPTYGGYRFDEAAKIWRR